jgi:hypothetical protein
MKILLMLCISFFSVVRSLSADAVPNTFLTHSPPASVDASQTEMVQLIASGSNITRVRALIQSDSGYRIAALEQQGDSFVTTVSFNQLAELRYRFQFQLSDGSLHESQNYVIRKLATEAFEGELVQMQRSLEILKSKTAQLQNNVQALRIADPKALAKQRHVEMARAMVLLSKREREVAEAEERLRNGSLEKVVQ